MNNIDVTSLLVQIRALSEKGGVTEVSPEEQKTNFSELIKTGIDKVNESQQAAGKMAEAFDAGDPDVDLADVFISLQKAGLSFQAMSEVRNRLVNAYQEIMNMPI